MSDTTPPPKVSLFRPTAPRDPLFQDELLAAIGSGQWATGPYVELFEEALRRYTGLEEIVAVSTGTMAARLLFAAVGSYLGTWGANHQPSSGHPYATPALGFVSPILESLFYGFRPVFMDIDPETWLVDPNAPAEGAPMGLVVDYGGYPVPDSPGATTAMIRDAAHHIGRGMDKADYPYTLFSFHPTKTVASFGGGAIGLGRGADLSGRFLRRLRDFGRVRGAGKTYDVDVVGTNGYMTNLSALAAYFSLREAPENDERRLEIASMYGTRLSKEFTVRDHRGLYHLYPVLLPRGCGRAGFLDFMAARGVEVGTHYPPLHRMSVFRGLGQKAGRLPVAEDVIPRIAILPCHPAMSDGMEKQVVDAANEWVESTPTSAK